MPGRMACKADLFSRWDPLALTWSCNVPPRGLRGRSALQVICKFLPDGLRDCRMSAKLQSPGLFLPNIIPQRMLMWDLTCGVNGIDIIPCAGQAVLRTNRDF